jgi:hypothetical protein
MDASLFEGLLHSGELEAQNAKATKALCIISRPICVAKRRVC